MLLNTSQQKAVEEDGIQLIIAGPGSGKTRVVTEKLLHLTKNGVKPQSILALTFSDKAARELIERLEKHIDPSDITAGTFHSFCLDVLRDNVLDSGISFASGVISRTNQLVWGLRNIDTFGFEEIEIGNNAIKAVFKSFHFFVQNLNLMILICQFDNSVYLRSVPRFLYMPSNVLYAAAINLGAAHLFDNVCEQAQ